MSPNHEARLNGRSLGIPLRGAPWLVGGARPKQGITSPARVMKDQNGQIEIEPLMKLGMALDPFATTSDAKKLSSISESQYSKAFSGLGGG